MQKDFERRKAKNPRYSQRAYAKYLGISSSSASQILSNTVRWRLLPQIALNILSKLDLKRSEKASLLHQLGVVETVARAPLNPINSKLLTNWLYKSIHTAHELPSPQRKPEQLALRFGATKDQVTKIIQELLKNGLLKLNSESGEYDNAQPHWEAGDGPPSEVIQDHHIQSAKLGIKALQEIYYEERSFSSLSFVGSSKSIEKVRTEIRHFEDKILAIMNEDDANDEVYQMNFALFPVRFKKED